MIIVVVFIFFDMKINYESSNSFRIKGKLNGFDNSIFFLSI